MPQEVKASLENNFTGGLKTEFTGLNFPENACTDTENCVFSLIGDVQRRRGYDYEENFSLAPIDRADCAISSYKWNNVGGDGLTQIVVEQIGSNLYFYVSSTATITSPLSTKLLVSTVMLSNFVVTGSSNDPKSVECQYADGNGYLFVYHKYCEPFYCTFDGTSITPSAIEVQLRDFAGIPEIGVPITFRSTSLTDDHNYNLQNQGWTRAPSWTATSTTMQNYSIPGPYVVLSGTCTFQVASGIVGVTPGSAVTVSAQVSLRDTNTNTYGKSMSGLATVTSYSGTTLVLNVQPMGTSPVPNAVSAILSNSFTFASSNTTNLIDTWHTAIGNYPSNGDVWWSFKDSTGAFNPSTTLLQVALASTPAPQGHFILNAFNQQRTSLSGIPNLTDVTTNLRPKTGAWFAGRTWYTGVDASQQASGDQPYTTWTESIYFSQIITTPSQFGMCYQTNDPTDENLFTLLPSDGGVINIQGSGSIYKLFPIQNGMLVFAANGIWFITGSQGIGFTANDYTITKISAVQSISSTSFVDVNGLPIFWNEEGIYTVQPAQQGLGLTVNPITVGTILSFFSDIPVQSKKFVRGAYNPIEYIVSWIYRDTNESSVTDRYEFNSVLNLNVHNQAFYPYSLSGTPKIHSIQYVAGPGGSDSPDPTFKYYTSAFSGGTYQFTFSEERDTDFLDWQSFDTEGVDYNSYFVTGYKLHGQALRKWQPEYVYMYSQNEEPTAYKIQGIWNYASSGNSGKYSSVQLINNDVDYFGVVIRRHRIRGSGISLQLKISSVTGMPFNILGWAVWENINSGI